MTDLYCGISVLFTQEVALNQGAGSYAELDLSLRNSRRDYYFNASDVAIEIEGFTALEFNQSYPHMEAALQRSGEFRDVLARVFETCWDDIPFDLQCRARLIGLDPYYSEQPVS